MPSEDARALMEAATDAVILIDHSGRIYAANPAAEQLFGYTQAQFIGADINLLMPEPDHSAHAGYLTRYLLTGESRIIGRGREVRALRKDGSIFPVALSVGRITSSDPPRFVGFLRDLSEQHRALAVIQDERDHARQREAEAHRSQTRLLAVSRMATMGEMAAGVAHEVNQPLTAISNYARACERFIASDRPELADIRDCVREIVTEARRAADIIRELRRMVQEKRVERLPTCPNDMVKQIQPLLLADARANDTQLEFALAEGLPTVRVDTAQIQQVLLNLVRNALEAFEGTPATNRRIWIITRLGEAGVVEISVRDNGPGVDPAIVDTLFDPFSTTKPNGGGLGLAISRTIVQAHDGRLTHRPLEAGGACFCVDIPAMENVPA
ncbi:MAG: PAS domain S-box protein [Pseudomonadota bacterium]